MTRQLHFLKYLIILLLFTQSNFGFGQCVGSVNYTGWTHYGDNSAGWQVVTTTSVQSLVNTNFPTFYVSPDTFINVKFSGDIKVNTSFDDDYIGFVMGYQGPYILAPPNSTTPALDMDFVVFDWKQSYQNYLGWITQAGKSLNKVDGTYTNTNASTFPGFWTHTNSTSWQVLASSWGNTQGYVDFVTYHFDIIYTPTRIIVYIDNVLLFDVTGCFKPGRIGFYNYSQEAAVYSNFEYELYMDFQIGAEDVCLGDTSFFTLSDTACYNGNSLTNIDTFYWDFGDGTFSNDTNPWHIYNTADTFSVSLVASDINGCIDTNTKVIRVHELPIAGFTSSLSCLGDSTDFFDASTNLEGQIVAWDWNFGNGVGFSNDTNPSYMYPSPGTFPVTFTIETEFGCIDSVVQNITVVTPPDANFSIQSACDGSPVQFTNLSTANSYAIATYGWDFENNQSIDAMNFNASHIYPIFDIYAVKLEVTDVYGCVDSIIKVVDVHPNPSVSFSAPASCFGDSSYFYDSSTVVNGSITDWMWVLDGGADTVYGQYAGYQFSTLGYHSILLYATSDSGCVGLNQQSTLIRELPQANFTASTACGNEATHFQQQCYTPVGVVNQWNWNFGNAADSVANPNYIFGVYGPQTVQLAIETNFGCRDTIEKTVFVYPVPQPLFSWDNQVCEGGVVQFSDQSSIIQVSQNQDIISSWFWDIDGSQYNVQNPSFQTLNSDQIPVKLRVTSNHGCRDSLETVASVFPKPEVNFEVDENCAHQETQFTSVSSISSGLIAQHRWDFGNGVTSLNPNPPVFFDSSGSYLITLKVISNAGCEDSIIREIVIPETPNAKFSLLESVGCSPLIVSPVNHTTISSGNVTYRWFIDNQFVTAQSQPSFVVENDDVDPKKFGISLLATSDAGCSSEYTLSDELTILPKPTANFSLLKDTLEPFDDYAMVSNKSLYGVKWLWKFGNGTTSNEFEPLYTYPESGTYIMELVAENIWKCKDSIAHGIRVSPFITMYIPSGFTPNGDGINDTWEIKGFNEGREFSVRVFDRWGGIIYHNEDLSASWDGKDQRNGELVPGGIYIYQVKYYSGVDEVKEMKGEITVVR